MVFAKKITKQYKSATSIGSDGFPTYRRRKDGRKAIVRGQRIGNRWVVPYNLDLLIKYNAHIKIELCARTKAIKYLYKYIHKGPDRATVVLEVNTTTLPQSTGSNQGNDEIKQYLDCKYISPPEACWRIFEFDLQAQRPPVERLQFHLPSEQFVVFQDNNDLDDVVLRPGIGRTMFTEWM
ncbi:uncharacterized protein LOC143883021 [Tasmannia lanceolata]|uniref:uncharacterized protein LOC143883021 n=1 Tax=Tasmannia lanceolata TaxID=3420 RepID=UPI004063F36C